MHQVGKSAKVGGNVSGQGMSALSFYQRPVTLSKRLFVKELSATATEINLDHFVFSQGTEKATAIRPEQETETIWHAICYTYLKCVVKR